MDPREGAALERARAAAAAGARDAQTPLRVSSGLAGSAALFTCTPLAGARVPALGYPSLYTLPIAPLRKKLAINVFGSASRKESVGVRVLGLGATTLVEDVLGLGPAPEVEEEGSSSSGSGSEGAVCSIPSVRAQLREAHVPRFREGLYLPGMSAAEASVGGGQDWLSAWLAARGAATTAAPLPLRDIAECLLGRVLYVDWPHLREGRVVAVSDGSSIAEEAYAPSAADAATLASAAARAPQASGATAGSGGGGGGGGALEPPSACITPGAPTAPPSPGIAYATPAWGLRACAPRERDEWTSAATALVEGLEGGFKALKPAGILMPTPGAPRLLLHCVKLSGMSRDPNTGALSRVWCPRGTPGGEMVTLPCLARFALPSADPRFAPAPAQTPEARFPPGSRVVLLRGQGRGCTARVVAVSEASSEEAAASPVVAGAAGAAAWGDLRLTLDVAVQPPEPPFGASIAASIKDKYTAAADAAALLRISPATLTRVTSSIVVRDINYDLGLQLRLPGGLFMPGYVKQSAAQAVAWRREEGGSSAALTGGGSGGGSSDRWVYTDRALALVAAYQAAFPAVFQMLESDARSESFPLRAVPGEGPALLKICTWLSQLETAKKPLVAGSTEILCPPAVAAVQVAADTWAKKVAAAAAAACAAAAAPEGGAPPPPLPHPHRAPHWHQGPGCL